MFQERGSDIMRPQVLLYIWLLVLAALLLAAGYLLLMICVEYKLLSIFTKNIYIDDNYLTIKSSLFMSYHQVFTEERMLLR